MAGRKSATWSKLVLAEVLVLTLMGLVAADNEDLLLSNDLGDLHNEDGPPEVNISLLADNVNIIHVEDLNSIQTDDEEDNMKTVKISGLQLDSVNNTNNNSSVGNITNKTNTGAIVAASVLAVAACFAVVLGVYLFKRKRESRMMDKEKKMQIQMSSARNAGVYQDLTVSVPTEDKPNGSPEHERLKAAENA